MGTQLKTKILINRSSFDRALRAASIGTLGVLAEKLRPELEDVSESSIYRWNANGWPEFKFRALCRVLKIKPEQIQN